VGGGDLNMEVVGGRASGQGGEWCVEEGWRCKVGGGVAEDGKRALGKI